ncbi:MAG TPA: DUF924 family protein [Lysobacter sp.]|nr:DUF924 family protein [Lysobacter sp.]
MSDPLAQEILGFWRAAGPARWFAVDPGFDRELATRFGDAHLRASRREFEHWLDEADSALALVLLLDQVPRNIYRGSPHAFATDPLARLYADRALAAGHDRACEPALRGFFYLPFEHSEQPEDQARSVALFEALGDAEYLRYAVLHRDLIARFGRFPHRNPILGRTMTAEEQAYLDGGGFAG